MHAPCAAQTQLSETAVVVVALIYIESFYLPQSDNKRVTRQKKLLKKLNRSFHKMSNKLKPSHTSILQHVELP
jgi:hypothetical protein